MVNEDWVKGVLRDLYNEAAARRDSAEALMFRQAASLIEQFHSPNKKNPDPQTVMMIQGQLDAAYYRELNRVFKRSNWHLCISEGAIGEPRPGHHFLELVLPIARNHVDDDSDKQNRSTPEPQGDSVVRDGVVQSPEEEEPLC